VTRRVKEAPLEHPEIGNGRTEIVVSVATVHIDGARSGSVGVPGEGGAVDLEVEGGQVDAGDRRGDISGRPGLGECLVGSGKRRIDCGGVGVEGRDGICDLVFGILDWFGERYPDDVVPDRLGGNEFRPVKVPSG